MSCAFVDRGRGGGRTLYPRFFLFSEYGRPTAARHRRSSTARHIACVFSRRDNTIVIAHDAAATHERARVIRRRYPTVVNNLRTTRASFTCLTFFVTTKSRRKRFIPKYHTRARRACAKSLHRVMVARSFPSDRVYRSCFTRNDRR